MVDQRKRRGGHFFGRRVNCEQVPLLRTDWLWGMVRHDYVFHGVVLLVNGAKE